MFSRPIPACGLFAALLMAGCHSSPQSAPSSAPSSPHDAALAANKAFLNQKTYDPWVLTSDNAANILPAYLSDGG